MTTDWHVPSSTLHAYVDDALRDADAWSVEAHLEACGRCRERIGPLLPGSATGEVVAAVRAHLPAAALPTQTPPVTAWRGRRMLLAGAPGLRVPWLVSTALVLGLAVAFDAASESRVSLVLLLAPVLPLLGVAASFGRGVDPAYEVTVTTPGAGLRLVLWRALAVVVPVTLATALAGALLDVAAPAAWLLPCLTMTVATLLLGSVLGLVPAAAVLATTWTALVVAPAVVTAVTPALLQPRSALGWALVLPLLAAGLLLRADSYRRVLPR